MRKSGILMPVFSLPSDFGIGTFGKSANEFVGFLAAAKQKVWQVLPLGYVDSAFSPYKSISVFAFEPLFIDFNLLTEDNLLYENEIKKYNGSKIRADYEFKKKENERLLPIAFSRFKSENFEPQYSNFLKKNEFWLKDFALFNVLRKKTNNVWTQFPSPLKERNHEALKEFESQNKNDIEYELFVQFIAFKQWFALKNYANSKGIEIMGDLPIYPSFDSADVWAHRKCFLLNESGAPEFIAGTPPDNFSKNGQVWGNPLYDFEYLKSHKKPYYWWVERISYALKLYDTIRIDHFRGFAEFFAIPESTALAKDGRWIKGPGIDLFKEVFSCLGDNLPIVAEDLGVITESVKELLKETGFCGMRVLQFGFDGNLSNPYLPHNFNKHTVAYIGTHDNETLAQFTENHPESTERLKKYIGKTNESINWATIRLVMSSVAETVIFSMQDIMSCKKEARINTPGTVNGNWLWRIESDCLNPWLAGILKDYTETYGR